MATCEGVTALVTLMLAIWSKIRVLESKFVTKGGRHGVKAGLGCLTLWEGGWAVGTRNFPCLSFGINWSQVVAICSDRSSFVVMCNFPSLSLVSQNLLN